jgi:hypothetical protein
MSHISRQPAMASHSYHDLHITTPDIPRTSIFDLPYRLKILCTRVGGWEAWAMPEFELREELLGGEYDYDAQSGEGKWLILDVAGYVICNSRDRSR